MQVESMAPIGRSPARRLEQIKLPVIDQLRDTAGVFLRMATRLRKPDTRTYDRSKLCKPWPQPSPWDSRMAPAILNVPPQEIAEFRRTVVARYMHTMFYHWPKVARQCLRAPKLEGVDDARFTEILTESAVVRHVSTNFSEEDRHRFAPVLGGRELTSDAFCKVDFSGFRDQELLRGLYVADTVTLLEHTPDDKPRVVAICLDGVLITPDQGKRWELTKYFVLQASAQEIILGSHATLHFPMDTVNAVTKAVLPESHRLRQLIEPHCYIQLAINYAVLNVDRSVAHNNQDEVYTAFPFKRFGNTSRLAVHFSGDPSNPRIAPYQFPMAAPAYSGPYGEFLRGYYGIIFDFVSACTQNLDVRDPAIVQWADTIAGHLDQFPCADALARDPGLLARAVTGFIFSVSVHHSADHHSQGQLTIKESPLRLRQSPPVHPSHPGLNPAALFSREDYFRQLMMHEMYVKTNSMRGLLDVRYAFEDGDQATTTSAYRERLRAYDAVQSGSYIPLSDIACSIQF